MIISILKTNTWISEVYHMANVYYLNELRKKKSCEIRLLALLFP